MGPTSPQRSNLAHAIIASFGRTDIEEMGELGWSEMPKFVRI